ncbi:MAG: aminotransferase [Acidimicrobiia bacterium]|nr:aminotransferase [Acidimicrobiia bacterium]
MAHQSPHSADLPPDVAAEIEAIDTARIVEADQRYLIHPYQMFDTYLVDSVLPISRGAGAELIDTEGNVYIDAVGGMWCTNIGLGRDEMADAIADQVRRLAYANPFVDMTNVPAVRLAEKLMTLAPGSVNHVFFTTGGSTAVDAAFRAIQLYQHARGKHDKRHVISRIDAYHGSTYASVSIGGKPGDRPPDFDFIDDFIHHLSSPNFYRFGGDRTEQEFADDLVAEFEAKVAELGGPDKVAAFFAEPIMGSGGVIPPPADYLQRIWRYCRDNHIVYVSDEVVTGFGRLGEWFVSETLFGILPDMITSAKGLTSGYLPLGALMMSDEIFDVISAEGHGRYFAVGYTYSGHPVSCAAALKNIEILEREGLLDHVKKVGPYFMEQLQTLRDLPLVGDVRGSHLMACVEFVADRVTRRRYSEELGIGKMVSNEADELGLIVRPIDNLNVMSPPLVITGDEIDLIVSRLREAIIRVQAELSDRGLAPA